MIKIAFFDSKEYDKKLFNEYNEKYGYQITYLESRLNLLDRVNQVFLFIDRFNEKEEIKNLDKFSLAELYYLKEYCPNKMFTIIGWDQANVPKYDKGKKWSLTSKEDIKVRRLVK